MGKRTNPLHDAVIADNVEAVKELKGSDWRTVRDKLGFTPLEIAQLLGRSLCEELLDTPRRQAFKVLVKGETAMRTLSLEELEAAFQFKYRTHLTFRSYQELQEVIAECPYLLRWRWPVRESHEWAEIFHAELAGAKIAKASIQWIDNTLGYGAFLDEDVPAGAYIGEYTGIVRRLYREKPDHNAYCFSYPTRFWSRKPFAIDSLHEGNITRFFNHSERPTVQTICIVDRGLLHQVFITTRPLDCGTPLTFDYGQEYWERRSMNANAPVNSRFRTILDGR